MPRRLRITERYPRAWNAWRFGAGLAGAEAIARIAALTIRHATGGVATQSFDQLILLALAAALVWMPLATLTFYVTDFTSRRMNPAAMWLVIVVTVLLCLVAEPFSVARPLGMHVSGLKDFVRIVMDDADLNLLLAACAVAVPFTISRFDRAEARLAEDGILERNLADARLIGLTLHLQPHFLFNTLQLVAESAHSDPQAAAKITRELARLVGESADGDRRRVVTVADEVRFIDAYLEIHRERYEERLRGSIRVDPRAHAAEVPHMLLQPLVENAIRFAVAARVAGGSIDVDIHLSDGPHGGRLLLTVTDDGPAVTSIPKGTGMGLLNTRDRLRAMYGEDFLLTLTPGPSTGWIASVSVPFRDAAARSELPDASAPTDDLQLVPWLATSFGFWLALVPLRMLFGLLRHPEFLSNADGLIDYAIRRLYWVGEPSWLVAAVVVFLVVRNVRLIVTHRVVAAVLTTLAVAALNAYVVAAREAGPGKGPLPTFGGFLLWYVLLYFALLVLGIARVSAFSEWVGRRSAHLSSLRDEIQMYLQEGARAKIHLTVLLACLERLEGACVSAPEAGDRCAMHLATLLRAVLAGLDSGRSDDYEATIVREFARIHDVAAPTDLAIDARVNLPPGALVGIAIAAGSANWIRAADVSVTAAGDALIHLALADEHGTWRGVEPIQALVTTAFGADATVVAAAAPGTVTVRVTLPAEHVRNGESGFK